MQRSTVRRPGHGDRQHGHACSMSMYMWDHTRERDANDIILRPLVAMDRNRFCFQPLAYVKELNWDVIMKRRGRMERRGKAVEI